MRPTAFSRYLAALLLLAIVLPATASSTMHAYLDAKGNRHYRDVKEGTNPTHGYGVLPVRFGSGELDRYIQTAAINHQVDLLLIKAVIKAESPAARWWVKNIQFLEKSNFSVQ